MQATALGRVAMLPKACDIIDGTIQGRPNPLGSWRLNRDELHGTHSRTLSLLVRNLTSTQRSQARETHIYTYMTQNREKKHSGLQDAILRGLPGSGQVRDNREWEVSVG